MLTGCRRFRSRSVETRCLPSSAGTRAFSTITWSQSTLSCAGLRARLSTSSLRSRPPLTPLALSSDTSTTAPPAAPSKLGDRQVDLQVSDQAELMKVLFPKAHAVQWVGNVPAVPERLASPYQTFRGFLSDEELTMMVKHVENPARVSPMHFIHACRQPSLTRPR